MPQTQRFIIASFALIAGIGLGFGLSRLATPVQSGQYDVPTVIQATTTESVGAFKTALTPLLEERFGTSTGGYEPQRVMYAYRGFIAEDFDKVEASVGIYEYKDGYLWYRSAGIDDATSDDISDGGYETLYKNVRSRLGVSDAETAAMVAKRLIAPANPPVQTSTTSEPVACPTDAKQCPDGSQASRVGETCEFADCPSSDGVVPMTMCEPESRLAEACIELYAPVCASVQVECVTTPCNPVPETFSNSCFACMNEQVLGYTEGACTPSE